MFMALMDTIPIQKAKTALSSLEIRGELKKTKIEKTAGRI